MNNPRLMIVASKGTLDWGLQTFIYAATASALGYEVAIFFTSYGVELLRRSVPPKVTLYGHPGVPIPLINNHWFPNILRSLPGVQALSTKMMERNMKKNGMPCLDELRELCISADIRFIASQTSLELLNLDPNDLISAVTDFTNEAPIIANQNQNCLVLQF